MTEVLYSYLLKPIFAWKNSNCENKNENALSEKQKDNKNIYEADEKIKNINYLNLYRYSTTWEKCLIFFGFFLSLLKALQMPLMIIIYGEFMAVLVDRFYGIGTSTETIILKWFGGGRVLTNATHEENFREIVNDSIAYGIGMIPITIVHFIAGIFSIDLLNQTGIKQITRIRVKYFEALLRQEIGWHDVIVGNNFAVRITDDVEKIRDAISEKVSQFVCLALQSLSCVVLSFAYGWELSLVVISYLPIVMISNTFIGKFQARFTARETDAYSIAANLVEEVLGGIRTVVAFCGEKSESERYYRLLQPALKASKRKGFASGLGDGLLRFFFYASNALAYWYGIRLVLNDRDNVDKVYTPASMMITFFGLSIAAENIAKFAPFMECFSAACGSATSIFGVIDRKSKIDSLSSDGKIINFGIRGSIEFRNITFNYPSRPNVPILRHISFTIKSGQTVALVGHSGNGKSTWLQLLQRFYDPDDGAVLIDDCDIRQLNLSLLRSNLALVGQEPVLFSTTIGENIRYGKPDATDKEIMHAAQDSGAHKFISNLPQGYNTLVGDKGCQLSGGQKQRIAIARALIQNPKILILDEATSALDYQSEKYVQQTLDSLSKGRTTVVVSHRLSAIRNADRILYIEKGEVVEDGNHNELIALKGRYYDMITSGTWDSEETAKNQSNKNVISLSHSHNEKLDHHEKINGKHLFGVRSSVRQLPDDIVDLFPEEDDSGEIIVKEKVPIQYWPTLKRILSNSKPELIYIFMSTIFAIFIGSSPAVFAILFGEFYGALSMENAQEARDVTFNLCMIFLAFGAIMWISAMLQTYWFNMAGVYLTTRIRSQTFSAMMKQEMGWFDDEQNSIGALSARLTGDAAHVQGAIGFPFSGIVQCVSTFIIGVVVAYSYSWKLATICLSAVPLVIVTVYIEAKHMAKSTSAEKKLIEDGTKIATEAITNLRTVASLRQEPHMINRYIDEMNRVESTIRKKIIWRGFVNSFGASIPLFGYAIALYYGGVMVANGEIHFKDIIKVSESLLYGSMIIGQSLIYAPAFTSAFVSANRLFQIIDRDPLVVSPIVANKTRLPDRRNNIDYKLIDFRYPTRPDIQILNGLSLNIAEGQTIALVGPSGCGKSTLVQLLQRLYDPERGRIHIGLDEISSDISLNSLRSKLSIVSQEPVLFERTIAENIAYGEATKSATLAEIIDAAKMANVHNFIAALPLGYQTNLGSKGAQLSGGQKQRIAIARALLRNPNILLLDEATSALDLQSEQIVQQALDSARTGRTCLIIAHRLSTVQNADVICVLQNGRINEMGTHNELLAADGIYAKLYHAQK